VNKVRLETKEQLAPEIAPTEVAQAIRTAIERCPEYSIPLASLSGSEWGMKVYAEAYAALRKRHHALSEEHQRLQRTYTETYAHAVMITDFVGHITRRLRGPVSALHEVASKLSISPSERFGDGFLDEHEQKLASSVNRLSRLMAELSQAFETMQHQGRCSEVGHPQPEISGEHTDVDVPIKFARTPGRTARK